VDARNWTAAADQSSGDLWDVLEIAGPVIFGLLLAVLVVRAIVRRGRYRAVGVLNDADREAVHAAIEEAERRTVGEILPVVLERSDPHPGASWLASLCFLLVGSALLAPWLPWERPALLLASQMVMGAAGFSLAHVLPGFKRVFIFEDRATAVAMEQAFQEFYANGLQKTEAATGVLLFVSLLEHRVVVLGDDGIDAKVAAEFWKTTDEAILQGIQRASLRDGLIDGIHKAGDLLAEHFPWAQGDRDEVPNRVIVRRE